MKTMEEVKNMLKLELIHWHGQQVKYIDDDFYLYYLPVSPHWDSGLLISKTVPASQNSKLVTSERMNKGQTADWNFNRIINVGYLDRLPILDA